MIGKGNDRSTNTQYQGRVDLTVCVGIRISLLWLIPCIYEILQKVPEQIRILHNYHVLYSTLDNLLTLIVMEIIVVSSSSVSMYSIYPFATRSCQPPSSGDSWKQVHDISQRTHKRSKIKIKKRLNAQVPGRLHVAYSLLQRANILLFDEESLLFHNK